MNLEEELEEDSRDYSRKLKDGYIKFKLRPNIFWRKVSLYCSAKYPKIKHIEKRLCQKDKKENHNICRLYVDYEYAGFGLRRTESIEIDGNFENRNDIDAYISGYSEALEDGSYIIYFGKTL